MGSALRITLSKPSSKGSKVKVEIQYKTTKDCTALQWLDKEYVSLCICCLLAEPQLVSLEDRLRVNSTRTCSVNVNLYICAVLRLYKIHHQ
jgi:hypothetical protein